MLKIYNPYSSNRKRSYKNWQKLSKNFKKYILPITIYWQYTIYGKVIIKSLVNNISEGIHRIKCKLGHNDKKCETCWIKYKYSNCFLKCKIFKDNLIEYNCSCCKKIVCTSLMKNLRNNFFNTFNFSDIDNKLILLCFFIWVYGWLGKIQWKFITWKRRFLQSLKYGWYYWCRLHTCKNSL